MQGLASINPKQLPDIGKRGTESSCVSLLTHFAPGASLSVAWAADWEAGTQSLEEAQLSLGHPATLSLGTGCCRASTCCTLGAIGLT